MASAQDIFLSDHHSGSGRYAIFEDNGNSAWLYLTEAGSQKPEKDALVYSPIPPVTTKEAIAEAKEGNPPPLSAEFAASTVATVGVVASGISFQWASDGQSVCLLYKGRPLAMITVESKRGYSQSLAKEGFYGLPWSQAVYQTHFHK